MRNPSDRLLAFSISPEEDAWGAWGLESQHPLEVHAPLEDVHGRHAHADGVAETQRPAVVQPHQRVVLILFIVYYRKLFVVTFDEEFAKASGLKASRYSNLIAILTALVIVVGMRMMGVMLISSIIIFPALTSMRIFKSFKKVVVSSGVVSVVSFILGIYLSYVYNISTGATIVLVNLVFFIIFTILEKIINE